MEELNKPIQETKKEVVITEEDRQKVSSLVASLTKTFSEPKSYKGFSMDQVKGEEWLTESLGKGPENRKKAEVLMNEIIKNTEEVRKAKKETNPEKYEGAKAKIAREMLNQETTQKKIDSTRDDILKKLG